MPTVNVVFGKSTKPAKFYHKGKRISVDTAFGMYQKKARFVVNGKALNVNRFGAVELSECPVCMEDSVLVKPFTCADRGIDHGICEGCARRIAQTTQNCPMCRAPPKIYTVTDEHRELYDLSLDLHSVLEGIIDEVTFGNAHSQQKWYDIFTTFETDTSNAANQIRHWMQVGDVSPDYPRYLEEFEREYIEFMPSYIRRQITRDQSLARSQNV